MSDSIVFDDLDAVGIDPDKIKVGDYKALCRVLRSVAVERARQDAKWGPNQSHDYGDWKAILGEEQGEADREYLRLRFTEKDRGAEFRQELVECAAVLVAMIECGDREGWFRRRSPKEDLVDLHDQQRTGDEPV